MKTTLPNHYETLSVPPGSSHEAIRAAYRALARQYHPDVNPSPEAAAMIRRVNHAWAVLGDPVARQEYDRELERHQPLPDHYAVLGVSPTSSQETLRAAYRALVQRHYLDSSPQAEAKLREINGAWLVLGNEKARREYDRAYRRQVETESVEHRQATAPTAASQSTRTIRASGGHSDYRSWGSQAASAAHQIPLAPFAIVVTVLLVVMLLPRVAQVVQGITFNLSGGPIIDPGATGSTLASPTSGPDTGLGPTGTPAGAPGSHLLVAPVQNFSSDISPVLDDQPPIWSFDGRYLLVGHHAGPEHYFTLVDVNNPDAATTTLTGDAAVWSPTEDKFATFTTYQTAANTTTTELNVYDLTNGSANVTAAALNVTLPEIALPTKTGWLDAARAEGTGDGVFAAWSGADKLLIGDAQGLWWLNPNEGYARAHRIALPGGNASAKAAVWVTENELLVVVRQVVNTQQRYLLDTIDLAANAPRTLISLDKPIISLSIDLASHYATYTVKPRAGAGEIYRLDVGDMGLGKTQLVSTEAPGLEPAWSPDQAWLIYTRRDSVSKFTGLWAVPADGATALPHGTGFWLGDVSPTQSAGDAAWSPNGTELCYLYWSSAESQQKGEPPAGIQMWQIAK